MEPCANINYQINWALSKMAGPLDYLHTPQTIARQQNFTSPSGSLPCWSDAADPLFAQQNYFVRPAS